MTDITLGQFIPGNSCIHRLDPRTKIVLMLVYIVMVFLVRSLALFLVPLLYVLLCLWLGGVIQGSQLMLQSMGGKVVPFVPAAGQTVVGQAAGPHDLRPGLIVLRIDVKDRSVFHDRAQEALRQRVRYLHLRTVGEVPFHGMHHDIAHGTDEG